MGEIWLRRVREIPSATMEIAEYPKAERNEPGKTYGTTRRA
jgi:hypothetical protein